MKQFVDNLRLQDSNSIFLKKKSFFDNRETVSKPFAVENIDAIKINFNQDQLFVLNISLAFLMFGVALNIWLEDFKKVFRRPKIPLVGLFSEYLLLPALTLLLIFIFRPATSLALGMVLIASCPGGNVSNFMVHLAKANAALSVILTSVTTLAAVIVTPLAFGLWSGFVPHSDSFSQHLFVDPVNMVKTIVQLVLVPVVLGMFVNYKYPDFTKKIERPIRILSIFIFLGFVLFAVIGNYENIKNYLHLVFLLVLIHNGLALLTGYWFARLNGLQKNNVRAISIETGIQNSGLGLILVFNFFDGLGGMAIILAWWGVWHLISGFALAMWWSRTSAD